MRRRRFGASSRPPASTRPAAIANRSHTWLAPVGGSTATCTVIGSESWLLEVVVSLVVVDTTAVLLMLVPAAAAATVVVDVNVADSLRAIVGLAHDSLPGFPVTVAEQFQPLGEVNDTSVSVDGRLSTIVTLSAASGPLFLATSVHVTLPPGVTTVGEAVLVTEM